MERLEERIALTAQAVFDADSGSAIVFEPSNFTVNDVNIAPGVSVVESDGSTLLAEGGATDSFDVALNTVPAADVQVQVSADANLEVSVDSINFFPSLTLVLNDVTPQTVTLRAVDDSNIEGPHVGAVSHSIIEPVVDGDYPITLPIAGVDATIADNDAQPFGFNITQPLGSLVQNASVDEAIALAGEVDEYLPGLDAGQSLTVTVISGQTLQAVIDVYEPDGTLLDSAVAAAPGEALLLQALPITAGGTHVVQVSGTAGTTGDYVLRFLLNAAVEDEDFGGPDNNSHPAAQLLDSRFLSLGGGAGDRAAVVGTAAPADDDYFRFSLDAGQSVSLVTAEAVSLDVLDDTGMRLAAGVNAGNITQAVHNFIAETTGSYVARVTAADAADYSLTIIRDADFDTESNSNLASAQDISGRHGALGHVQQGGGGQEQFDTPVLNFDGHDFNGAQPPDMVGDVGIDYYIQALNHPDGTEFSIYHKSDGSLALGPVILDTLAPPGSPGANGAGDPIVLYDHLADRWLLAEFTSPLSGTSLNVYISQTDDPTDNLWHFYSVSTPDFPDYPKIGVWPDGYYVSTNEDAPAVYVLDREHMLLGLPARPAQRFVAPPLAGFPFQALTPSDLDGPPPPPGSPNYFMRHRDDEAHNPGQNDPSQDFLEVWEFRADFNVPANSSFTQAANIAISEFDSDLCGLESFNCFPQPNSLITLDPLREVIMHRLQYRRFVGYETLVGSFVTDVDSTDHGGVRWFELRRAGGGTWSLLQEGTIAPDANHRWISSIAMDGNGSIAVGYNVSGTNLSPGIRYTGRLATDPLGTMPQGEHVLVAGQGNNGINRWGDYSAMSVDPVDDRTFWFTGEYADNGVWSTRIGSMKLEPPTDSDWYQFAATAGNLLTIETSTPADGPLDFANEVDPQIELYGPDEILVAADDNSSPADTHNALLQVTAGQTGIYRVRVSSVNEQGAYFVSIDGADSTSAAPEVIAASPSDAAKVTVFPTTFAVTFSEGLRFDSVTAADLIVGGLPATAVNAIDGDTFQFTVDPAAHTGDGIYAVSLAAGSVTDLQGELNTAFASTFELDTAGPIITSTFWNGNSLPVDHALLPGPLNFEAHFNEPLKAFFRAGRGLRSPDAADISLVNDTTAEVFVPAFVDSNSENTNFEAFFNSLTEGSYTLTLLSGSGAFEDVAGNDLDGEALGMNTDGTPSGDAVAGGDYVIHFVVDAANQTASDFLRLQPLGGLIFESTLNAGILHDATDDDAFSFFLEGGQTISARAFAEQPVTLSIDVPGISSVYASASPGAAAILPPTFVPSDGTYEVRVTADGAAAFGVDLFRNAGLEAEIGDTADGSELSIGDSYLPLGSGRYAVLGSAQIPLAGPLEFTQFNDPTRFVDISGTGTPLGLSDDGEEDILTTVGNDIFPAGPVTVSNNGGIIAGGNEDLTFANTAIPNISFETALLPFWDDIDNDDGDVYWEQREIDGLPALIVQWDQRPHYSNVGDSTFQLQLFASGPVLARFVYPDVDFGDVSFDGGASATIGYQQTSAAATPFSFNSAVLAADDVLELARPPLGVDVDEFEIDLTDLVGESIDVVLAGLRGATFTGQTLEVLDVDGTTVLRTATSQPLQPGVLATNFDLAVLDFQVPAAGVYTLRVTSTDIVGDYSIMVADATSFETEPNNDSASEPLRTLNPTQATLGYLRDGDAEDQFELHLTSGQTMRLGTRTLLDDPAAAVANSLDPALVVLHPDGSTVVASDADSRDGKNAIVSFTAPETGSYLVKVVRTTGSGEYLLEFPISLTITEIMYDPASDEDDWEWIEVYNPGTAPVDLAGFVIDDGDAVEQPGSNLSGGVVAPGATAVLFNADDVSTLDFEAAWGTGITLVPVTGWANMSLSAVDQVGIWSSYAAYRGDHPSHHFAIDSVSYDSGPAFPASNDSASIFLIGVELDNASGSYWGRSEQGRAGAYVSAAAGGNSGQDVGSPGLIPAAGVAVVETEDDTSISEDGDTDTYEISLNTLPLGAVEITVAAASQTEVSADGANFFPSVLLAFSDTAPQLVSVRAVDDGLAEGPHAESLTHTITTSADQDYPLALPIPAVDVQIADNDALGFQIGGPAAIEEGDSGQYTLTVAGQLGTLESADVDLAIVDVETSPSDYTDFLAALDAAIDQTSVTRTGNTLTFDENSPTVLTIDVQTIGDQLAEEAEDFQVVLSNATSATGVAAAITTAEVTTTLLDSDAVVFDLLGSGTVEEGSVATYALTLTGTVAAAESASVDVELVDVETDSSDYADFLSALDDAIASTTVTRLGNTLTFDDESPSSIDINLMINDDDLAEGGEAYRLRLANPTRASGGSVTVGSDQVDTTITDNDIVILGIAGDVSVTELSSDDDNNQVQITISYAGILDVGEVVSVDVNHVFDQTDAFDYTTEWSAALSAAASGSTGVTLDGITLSFTGGPSNDTLVTAVVVVAEDLLAEGAEDFLVSLSNHASPTGALTALGTSQVTATILDAEQIVFSLSGPSTVSEGDSATYTLGFIGTLAPDETASVDIELVHLQTDSSDYADFLAAVDQAIASTSITRLANMLTFDADSPPDIDIVLDIASDGTAEGPEQFRMQLSNDASSTGVATTLGTSQMITTIVEPATIAGRYIFYNKSAFDEGREEADVADDGAIAPNKTPLLPGQSATFANYTSYARGVNGIMIDILGLPVASLSESDFSFRVGNSDDVNNEDANPLNDWVAAPAPLDIQVRPGAGAGNSDRVTVIWSENEIQKQWLQVVVLATPNTGLAVSDTHYWGNAIADTGDSAGNTAVSTADVLGARANPHTLLNPAALDDVYDFNRDSLVNTQDPLIARNNTTTILNDLNLINPPDDAVENALPANLTTSLAIGFASELLAGSDDPGTTHGQPADSGVITGQNAARSPDREAARGRWSDPEPAIAYGLPTRLLWRALAEKVTAGEEDDWLDLAASAHSLDDALLELLAGRRHRA